MLTTSKYADGSRQAATLAALLMLSACGSGDHANPSPEPGPSAYIYVASAGSSPDATGAVYEYYVEGNSVVPMPQPSIAAGIDPAAVVAYRPYYLYVVNVGDGTISQYSIGSDGTLTALNPATVKNPGMQTSGATSAAASIDSIRSVLYVTNAANNTLSQFSIGSDGRLTPLTPATVATGVNPVAIYRSGINSDPAYVVNSGAPGDTGTVSVYSSGTDGALTQQGAPAPAGVNPSAIVVNQLGSMAYVVSNCDGPQCTGTVRQFAVDNASGALTDTDSSVTTGSHEDAVTMVYSEANVVGNQDFCTSVFGNASGSGSASSTLWQYDVGSTGQLTPADPPTIDLGPVTLAAVKTDELGSLYVLTVNAGNEASAEGSIEIYGTGAGCATTLYGSSSISAPHPVAIAVVGLLAP